MFSNVLQQGKSIPISVQTGDRVLLPEYGGTKVEFENKVRAVYSWK